MKRELNLHLPPADDLFSVQKERDAAQLETVREISLDLIDDFPNHPFKVRMDRKMLETIESIGQYGVLVPALVRPKADGRYEMVAGHRRKFGSAQTRRGTMPCIIRNLTDDEATIVMVDSNLQREEILPSEKAFAYKMKLDALKRQGQRSDLTLYPPGTKLNSHEQITKESGDSRIQIHRYVRLTHLVPELLEMVDNGALAEKDKPQIALRPAVELSYLPHEAQAWIVQVIAMEAATPSHAQTLKMRKFLDEGKLNEGVVLSIMQEEKPNQAEQIKFPRERISQFFAPDTPAEKIMDTIVQALELLQRSRTRPPRSGADRGDGGDRG